MYYILFKKKKTKNVVIYIPADVISISDLKTVKLTAQKNESIILSPLILLCTTYISVTMWNLI